MKNWKDVAGHDTIEEFLEDYASRLVALIKMETAKLGFDEKYIWVDINDAYISCRYETGLPVEFITTDGYIQELFMEESTMFGTGIDSEYGSMHVWHYNSLEDMTDELFTLLEMDEDGFELWRKLQ